MRQAQYIYPPRPECVINPANLSMYETGEYIAQPKLNGTSCVAVINEGSVLLYNRHGEVLGIDEKRMDFHSLYRGEKQLMLCGELLNKNLTGEDGKLFSQRFAIWDIIMMEGVHLLGTTVENRKTLIDDLYKPVEGKLKHLRPIEEAHGCYVVNSYDKTLPGYWYSLYHELLLMEIYEGLVIKRKNGRLLAGNTEKNNSFWQVKARRATKTFHF